MINLVLTAGVIYLVSKKLKKTTTTSKKNSNPTEKVEKDTNRYVYFDAQWYWGIMKEKLINMVNSDYGYIYSDEEAAKMIRFYSKKDGHVKIFDVDKNDITSEVKKVGLGKGHTYMDPVTRHDFISKFVW